MLRLQIFLWILKRITRIFARPGARRPRKGRHCQGQWCTGSDGVKAFVPKEIKVENEDDIVTLPDSQYIESEDFELCGHMWSLRVYPHGIDEHSDCVAIRVQNKSPNMINAYYNISLKRSDSPTDDYRMNMWVDPELDKLCFRRVGHPDSNWGCDDFISFEELYDPNMDYMDLERDILYVELQMQVYGDDILASHPLKKAIETGAGEDALLEIADTDLTTIKNAMKGSVPLNVLINQQNRLLDTLAPANVPTKTERAEMQRQEQAQKAQVELNTVIKTVNFDGNKNMEKKTSKNSVYIANMYVQSNKITISRSHPVTSR